MILLVLFSSIASQVSVQTVVACDRDGDGGKDHRKIVEITNWRCST